MKPAHLRRMLLAVAAAAIAACGAPGASPETGDARTTTTTKEAEAMTRNVQKTDAEWREELTPEEYRVLREQGTERPYSGLYVDEKADGVYRCAACGAKLFTSETKFDSHCGWPSFSDADFAENVETRQDLSHGMVRTEVLCKQCGGHLGHLFDDGPAPTGLRYCINSVALDLDRKTTATE